MIEVCQCESNACETKWHTVWGSRLFNVTGAAIAADGVWKGLLRRMNDLFTTWKVHWTVENWGKCEEVPGLYERIINLLFYQLCCMEQTRSLWFAERRKVSAFEKCLRTFVESSRMDRVRKEWKALLRMWWFSLTRPFFLVSLFFLTAHLRSGGLSHGDGEMMVGGCCCKLLKRSNFKYQVKAKMHSICTKRHMFDNCECVIWLDVTTSPWWRNEVMVWYYYYDF